MDGAGLSEVCGLSDGCEAGGCEREVEGVKEVYEGGLNATFRDEGWVLERCQVKTFGL